MPQKSSLTEALVSANDLYLLWWDRSFEDKTAKVYIILEGGMMNDMNDLKCPEHTKQAEEVIEPEKMIMLISKLRE